MLDLSCDFLGSEWEPELSGMVPTPVFAGAANESLDWAIVCLDRLFLIPPQLKHLLIIPELKGCVVCYSIKMINKVVLHELFHLCGCSEKESRNCVTIAMTETPSAREVSFNII